MKKVFLLVFSVSIFPCWIFAQVITTIAGGGNNTNDGILATSAKLGGMANVAFDRAGNLYIAEGSKHKIRKIDHNTGIITTVAGTGTAGFSGDNGLATNASLNWPVYICFDTADNLFISDTYNNRVRRVNAATGIITTYAGDGMAASTGDGGMADTAGLNGPEGLAFDSVGNLYIAEYYHKIRIVRTSGIINTVTGNGLPGYSGDGGPASQATINGVLSICVFKNCLYLGDGGNARVRKIDLTTNIITTIAGDGGTGNYNGDNINCLAAGIGPYGITFDTLGNLYIADYDNYRIRKVDTGGIIHTVAGTGVPGFAGDGGQADTSKVNHPEGVAINKCGNLYIVDFGNNRIREVAFNPTCTPTVDTTDTTTTVRYINAQSSISIYPNPAREQITIMGGSNAKDIVILNAIGQMMIADKSNSYKDNINVSSLKEGLYYIIVKDEKSGKAERMKFLKE